MEDWRGDSWQIRNFNLSLLETGYLSDVEFLVGPDDGKEQSQKILKAHKFILSVRSSVFETMFGEIWTSGLPVEEIKIPDADPEVFMSFLKFLYADCFVTSIQEVNNLLYLGHKYNISSLIVKCAEFFLTTLTTSNVVGIYQIASIFDLKDVKEISLAYLLVKAGQVFKDEEFLALDIDTLCDIIRQDGLCIAEKDLFHAVLRWASKELERTGLAQNFLNIRKILQEKVIPQLRFLEMSVEDFAKEVAGTGILEPDVENLIFRHFLMKSPNPYSCLPAVPFNINRRNIDVNFNILTGACVEKHSAGVYLTSTICDMYNIGNSFLTSHGRIYTESLEFSTSRDVRILGIGLYGPLKRLENGQLRTHLTSYEVEVALYSITVTAAGKISRCMTAPIHRVVTTSSNYEIPLHAPTAVSAGKIYHIRLAFKGEETQHGICRLSTTNTGGDVTFNFVQNFNENTLLGHNASPGRIRAIVFCTIPEEVPTVGNESH